MRAKAYCDGRGNAGTGACATVITVIDDDGKEFEFEFAKKLGPVTNNVAEYEGVILALEESLSLGVTRLQIFSDSQLVVSQTNGVFQVKNTEMKALRDRVWVIGGRFSKVTISWIPREKNKRADKLCRKIDVDPSSRPHPLRKDKTNSENPFL